MRALLLITVVAMALGGLAKIVPIPSPGNPVSAASADRVSTTSVSSAVVAAVGPDLLTSRPVSLDDYLGRPVVLNIWASWCEGCRIEAAEILKLAQTHRDLAILGIDYRDQAPAAAASARAWGWTHPSIFDPSGQIGWNADIVHEGIPTTLFLNSHHQVVARIVGNARLEDFEAGVRIAQGS
jgi:thiol-disulfide isomerase/thioredoxin